MSSAAHYETIRARNLDRLRSGAVEVDATLAAGKPDCRRGVSLIIPAGGIASAYAALADVFAAVERDQYYYPAADLHVTVFDFIQGTAAYRPDADKERAFRDIAAEAARSAAPFDLTLRGVVGSAGALLIAGYDGDALVRLRERIRILMAERGLPNDERYESRSAHVTFLRFARQLAEPARFVETMDRHRETPLGTVRVERMELVEHDWYNAAATKRLIATVGLS